MAAKDNGDDGVDVDKAEKEARGESTMPERFRYLTKEAPDPPLRWPLFVGSMIFILSFVSFSVWLLRKCTGLKI